MVILVMKRRFGHAEIMFELESLMGDRLSGGADGDLGAGARFGIASRIAGYQLEELIGQGGMAFVYRAVDERLGRKVAVKILAPATAADAAFRQRFLSESRAAAAVDHPNILPIYEAGEYDGVLYIAMRYVSGRDVRVLLGHGPLPALRAASVISPIASALDAAHAQGLVHRDVKPANILLDVHAGRPDHMYLSDFGLSKGVLPSAGLTDGQFVGTPEYVAPEQVAPAIASGHQLDGRADQYSLACTAFHLLAGVPPFQRDHYLAVIYAHTSDLPPMLTAIRGDLPQEVDAVLGRALAKSPQDRYASCAGFAEALRQVLGLPPYHVESDAARAERSATVALARQTESPGQDVLDTIVAAAQVAPQARAGSATAIDPDAADDLSSTAGHSRRSEQVASGAAGSRKSRKIAALAGLAVALVAGGAVTLAALTSAPPGTHLKPENLRQAGVTRTPQAIVPFTPVPGSLRAVTTSTGSGAWALGQYCVTGCGTISEIDQPVILRWNGTSWSEITGVSPGASSWLRAGADGAGSTAWAVGGWCQFRCTTKSAKDKTLILRWNGAQWLKTVSPNPGGNAWLRGISSASDGETWAVGGFRASAAGYSTLAMRWNGSAWTQAPSPSPGLSASLYGISVVSSDDAWAVGSSCTSACGTPYETDRSLIMHWNGTAWQHVPSPSPDASSVLYSVATAPGDTAWAAGISCISACFTRYETDQPLILHWDGAVWTQTTTPHPATGAWLRAVSASQNGGTWAIGGVCLSGCHTTAEVDQSLILRWNGSSWTQIPSPGYGSRPVLYSVSTTANGDDFIVGRFCKSACFTTSEIDETLILRWNGAAWTRG